MRIGSYSLITSAVDMTVPWTSEALWIAHVQQFSISLLFSGTPEGTLKLQCSNDEGNESAASDANRSVDVDNWSNVADSSQLIDEAGDHTWSVMQPGYRWIRVVWTPSASTGSLTSARISTKGF
jgi:hypothetical protein